MTKSVLEITPSTTVYDLLSQHPDLAAPFKKLRNPALKNSIARIATLKHIASVGNIPLNELIDSIRDEVGQPEGKEAFEDEEYFGPEPDWFSEDRISISLVEGEVGDKDEMTIVAVLREAANLEEGGIIELITTFLPAPGIDTMKAKGYSAWTTKSEGDTIRTYFIKERNT
jgi:hypothetical protein